MELNRNSYGQETMSQGGREGVDEQSFVLQDEESIESIFYCRKPMIIE
jgi:hypothetical protein